MPQPRNLRNRSSGARRWGPYIALGAGLLTFIVVVAVLTPGGQPDEALEAQLTPEEQDRLQRREEAIARTAERDTAAGSTAADRCAAQWDEVRAAQVAGDWYDGALRATLRLCPDYSTWQRSMDRVGGQSPNTLRAGCLLEPDTRVCVDARERGAL